MRRDHAPRALDEVLHDERGVSARRINTIVSEVLNAVAKPTREYVSTRAKSAGRRPFVSAKEPNSAAPTGLAARVKVVATATLVLAVHGQTPRVICPWLTRGS